MALHGNIQVNHNTIGTWSAQRAAEYPGGRHYIYLCRVEYTKHGNVLSTKRSFFTAHAYGAGALVLASRVMLTASEQIERAVALSEEDLWAEYCTEQGIDPSILGSWVNLR